MSTSPLSPDDIRAAAEVHQELGPEYSDAVVASFLDKVDREVSARVEARLAGVPGAAAVKADSRRTLLNGMALGVTVSGIPLLVLLGVHARHVAQAAATSVARPGGGHTIQVISRSQSTSFGWLVLLLVIVAVCGVAAVRIRRQPASQRMASGRG
jgi:hypothetical protein